MQTIASYRPSSIIYCTVSNVHPKVERSGKERKKEREREIYIYIKHTGGRGGINESSLLNSYYIRNNNVIVLFFFCSKDFTNSSIERQLVKTGYVFFKINLISFFNEKSLTRGYRIYFHLLTF
jgi:hypothetical protein